MKKIIFIAVALIVALGGLGIGYARWTDSVTISGNVNTGSLDLTITNICGDEIWKDLETEELVYCHWAAIGPPWTRVYWVNPPVPGLLVAYSSSEVIADDTVQIDFHNLFPIDGGGFFRDGCYLINVYMRNNGTVPMKVSIAKEWSAETPALLKGCLRLMDETLDPNGPWVDGKQLEPGEWLWLVVQVCIPDDNAYQNLSGVLTLTVNGVQWNEYVAP